MSGEELSVKPLHALEEQLARQKSILSNSALIQKLPDRGEKMKVSLMKIEIEIAKRRKEVALKKEQMSAQDLEELEWALGPRNLSDKPEAVAVLDSDDDEDGNSDPLKLVATSQISQRGPKKMIIEATARSNIVERTSEDNDRFTKRLVKTDLKKGNEAKFVPGKSLKIKEPGSSSPAESTSSSASASGSTNKKWDESLLPPSHNLESTKLLSMDETMKIERVKLKQFEDMKAAAPPKKVYAYDKLREQGLLGTYSLEMQTTRPVRTDTGDDVEDDDLSDDQITEESETSDAEENLETSKDLSNLVNANLKLK